MLTPPDLPADSIAVHLHDRYGLHATRSTFLPAGADADAAAYRIEAHDGTAYFLKLRRRGFAEAALAVPTFLRRERAIAQVMAALPTADGRLSATADGFGWALYPHAPGVDAFAAPLSDAQWAELGAAVGAVHRTALPAALAELVAREDYSPRLRDTVRAWLAREAGRTHDDPVARRFAMFLAEKRDGILTLVERAEELSGAAAGRALPLVVCHADLHAGNVVASPDGGLSIVDWDELVLAPKERDLMFAGGGVGGVWNDPAEEALFYRGYGAAEVDRVVLGYYRHERIVADVAATCEQVFGARGSLEGRIAGLRQMTDQFLPGNVVEIAHRTYERVA